MSKRSVFTTITPIPAGVTRQAVLDMLHDHLAIIDLNPQVAERVPSNPPKDATAEEYVCKWYTLTDKIQYLPGGLYSGKVSYQICFQNLPDGLSSHCYAPLGLNIRSRWQVGGSMPGEPKPAQELGLGIPKEGLYLREDVDMKCNILLTKFVKGNLKKTHVVMVERLVEMAQLHGMIEQQKSAIETKSSIMSAPSTAESVQSQTLSSPGYAPSQFGHLQTQYARHSLPSGYTPATTDHQGYPVSPTHSEHHQQYMQYPQTPDGVGTQSQQYNTPVSGNTSYAAVNAQNSGGAAYYVPTDSKDDMRFATHGFVPYFPPGPTSPAPSGAYIAEMEQPDTPTHKTHIAEME